MVVQNRQCQGRLSIDRASDIGGHCDRSFQPPWVKVHHHYERGTPETRCLQREQTYRTMSHDKNSVSRFYLCYSWTNCRNDPRDLVSKTPLSAVVPKREVVIVDQVASPADRASLNFDKNLPLHRFWDRDISFQLDATLSNQLEAAHPVHSLAVNNLRNECTVIF